MEYLYLMIILLIARLFKHIHTPSSFLGTKRGRTAQGLKDSLTNSLEINSSTFLWISVVSSGFILQASLFRSIVLEIRSMWCWMSLLGGKPEDISSRKA